MAATLFVDGIEVVGIKSGQPSVEAGTLTLLVEESAHSEALRVLREHQHGSIQWKTGLTEVIAPLLGIEDAGSEADGHRIVLRIAFTGKLRPIRHSG